MGSGAQQGEDLLGEVARAGVVAVAAFVVRMARVRVEVLANTGDGRAERGGVHDEIPRDVVHGRLPGADLVEAERRMAGDVRAVVARGAGAVELAEVGEKAGALRGGRRGAVRAGGGHRGPLWEDGPRG